MSKRVRYGRVNTNPRWVKGFGKEHGHWDSELLPKNTLVTRQDGDCIWFGIARCNRGLDLFKKTSGVNIATQRCDKAQGGFAKELCFGLTVHHSGLRGVVPTEKVKELLRYFDNIDATCKSGQVATPSEAVL